MSIFNEVAKGLGGIGREVIRQATGQKSKKHRREYRNLNRYTTDELTQLPREIQRLVKEAFKK
jgi:hypothetical protein